MMSNHPEYQDLPESDPLRRLSYLLMKLDSDRRNKTDYFTNKFIGKVEAAFKSLPKPVQWQSFYINDLKPYLKLDDDVKSKRSRDKNEV